MDSSDAYDEFSSDQPTMPTRGALARRLLSFSATIGLGTAVGIISIPVVIGAVGAATWAQLAIIQGAALLFGVVVSFGWGTTGPSQVAAVVADLRPQLYLDSLVSRVYLFLLAAPALCVLLLLLVDVNKELVIIGSLAYLMPFLGAPWYFVGEAKPWRLFLLDSLPQILGMCAGLVTVHLTRELWTFVVMLLLGNLVAVILSATRILRGPTGTTPLALGLSPRGVVARLYPQRHGVITAATGALYVYLPVFAVNAFLPESVLAIYVLADRFVRYGLMVFAPVLQFVQGWIPEHGAHLVRPRMWRAVQLGGGIGVIGGLCVWLLSPVVAPLLSPTEPVLVPFGLSLPLGVAFAAIAISQIIGLACLVLIGEGRALAASTVIGAVVGAPLILLAGVFAGLPAVAWAVAISELLVAAYQLVVLRRRLGLRTEIEVQY